MNFPGKPEVETMVKYIFPEPVKDGLQTGSSFMHKKITREKLLKVIRYTPELDGLYKSRIQDPQGNLLPGSR